MKKEKNKFLFTLIQEEKQIDKGVIGATFDISSNLPLMSNTNYCIEF